MNAATLELLGLHEAAWWALVERFEAALGLVALALGALSLLALALAGVEWAARRRAVGVLSPTTLTAATSTSLVLSAPAPIAASMSALMTLPEHALSPSSSVAALAPPHRHVRARTRALVRHLTARVACPIRASAVRRAHGVMA